MYKTRIMGLNTFTVIEWDADDVIFPRQSELFDQMTARGGKVVEPSQIKRDRKKV